MYNAAAAAFVLDLLRQLPDVTIRLGELGAATYGAVSFTNRVITISNCVTPNEFRSTLMYELVRLWRGPTYATNEDLEERLAATATALLLVPPELLILPSDVHTIAEQWCVDHEVAALALKLAAQHHQEVV